MLMQVRTESYMITDRKADPKRQERERKLPCTGLKGEVEDA